MMIDEDETLEPRGELENRSNVKMRDEGVVWFAVKMEEESQSDVRV